VTCVAMKVSPVLSIPHACTHDFGAYQPIALKKNDVPRIHSCEDPRWPWKLEVDRPVVLQHKVVICESEKNRHQFCHNDEHHRGCEGSAHARTLGRFTVDQASTQSHYAAGNRGFSTRRDMWIQDSKENTRQGY
jgi:hypothetical protein